VAALFPSHPVFGARRLLCKGGSEQKSQSTGHVPELKADVPVWGDEGEASPATTGVPVGSFGLFEQSRPGRVRPAGTPPIKNATDAPRKEGPAAFRIRDEGARGRR